MKKAKKQTRIKMGTKSKLSYVLIAIASIIIISAIYVYQYSNTEYKGKTTWIMLTDSSDDSLKNTLKSELGEDYGSRVYKMWNLMGGDAKKSQGAYKIEPGITVFDFSRRLKNSRQTPVKVIFNNVRTMDILAEKISKDMRFTKEEFLTACDEVLKKNGFKYEEYPAVFFPDTYEFYWTATPQTVVERMLGYYNAFWTEQRKEKATELGLTPIQVSTLASIVEEETNKQDERPLVARLYLNRIKIGMKLQADPTIKFALGDFTLRRIYEDDLKVESPYNTYKYNGVPPGPIRIVSKKTLDGVLDAPQHNNIYMCAKEDFSGYHNFAEDYDQHLANARRYQKELNRRNIK